LARFNDEQNDHAPFIGWYDYAIATRTMPIEAQVHQAWYFALQPTKLNPQLSVEPYEELFPNLRLKSRPEQKRMLNSAIEEKRTDNIVMGDSQTDTRPLMLGWDMATTAHRRKDER
jgi:hypothetical protein